MFNLLYMQIIFCSYFSFLLLRCIIFLFFNDQTLSFILHSYLFFSPSFFSFALSYHTLKNSCNNLCCDFYLFVYGESFENSHIGLSFYLNNIIPTLCIFNENLIIDFAMGIQRRQCKLFIMFKHETFGIKLVIPSSFKYLFQVNQPFLLLTLCQLWEFLTKHVTYDETSIFWEERETLKQMCRKSRRHVDSIK